MRNFLKILSAILLTGLVSTAFAQDAEQTRTIVKRIADHILDNTDYTFTTPDGVVVEKVTEKNYSDRIRITSPYNQWRYWNGVLNIAMVDIGSTLGEAKYTEFATRNYAFAFDNYKIFEKKNPERSRKYFYNFFRLYDPRELDDCGAEAGGLIEVYKIDPQKRYMEYLKLTADHILKKQDRLSDGTLVRKFPHEMTLWADDLYMSVVFLSRMGKLTGEEIYFEDAIRQVEQFTKYLWNPVTQLYYHCWYSDIGANGVAHWGRCNGWVMLAIGDLIDQLPANHPKRSQMIGLLRQHIVGVSRYQSEGGLWHQLLDKSDSYLETSASSMFIYSIARGVNRGWVDTRYMSIALEGWSGMIPKITEDGQVMDICVGTGIRDDITFYYKRPVKLNDIHGLGAVLMAGTEVLKYQQSKSEAVEPK